MAQYTINVNDDELFCLENQAEELENKSVELLIEQIIAGHCKYRIQYLHQEKVAKLVINATYEEKIQSVKAKIEEEKALKAEEK